MAKQSGLGDNFYIAGYDLSGDIASLDQISGGPALLDVTAINKSANERIGGLRDGDMQFTSFFDYHPTGQGAAHNAFSALPRTDVVACYLRGTTLGNAAACCVGKQLNYDLTRDNTGNLTAKVEVQANGYGMEWGSQVTAGLRTDTTPTTGAAYDQSAGNAYGAQAYLQLVALTGTNVDVAVQHCTTSGGTYASLVDFGSMTAIGAARAAVTGTVDRYLKVVTTGTFTSATFAVVFVLNSQAVNF